MSRRTTVETAYESTLDGAITAGATTIPVADASGITPPIYLAIEPDSPTLREIIKVDTKSGNNLTSVTRGVAGSAGGAQAHADGVAIRSVVTESLVDDLFQDIEDIEDLGWREIEQSGSPTSITVDTWTKVTTAGNSFGVDPNSDISRASGDWTINNSGLYLITAAIQFTTLHASTTLRAVRIVNNGTTVLAQNAGPGGTNTASGIVTVSAALQLAAADVISIEVFYTGGSGEDIDAGSDEPMTSIIRLD